MSAAPPTQHLERRLVASVRAADTVVEVEGQGRLRADASGRWVSVTSPRGLLRRTMDGGVVRREAGRARRLPPEAMRQTHLEVARLAARYRKRLAELGAEELFVRGGDREALDARLRAVAAFGLERLEAEPERFARAYPEPVTILPPDRYRDLVVLPSVGCPNAGCSFCAFYRDRRYRPLGRDVFGAHLRAVQDLFGPLGPGRRGVFLGSGSALSLGQRRMEGALEQVAEVFGSRPAGVASFLDPEHAPTRDAAQWSALGARGLRQVIVGLETGYGELRASLGKAADLGRFDASIRAQKEAGLCVGITVLIGAGGAALAAPHREHTVARIAALPLERGDRVYLSPLEEEERPGELELFRERLRPLTPAHIAPYRMELFHYYAG